LVIVKVGEGQDEREDGKVEGGGCKLGRKVEEKQGRREE